MVQFIRLFVLFLLVSAPAMLPTGGAVLAAAAPEQLQARTEVAFPAFKIAGNLYFVGGKEHSNFLVTTPQGHILINTGYADTVAMIKDSVEQLGFNYRDIKIILINHAHTDHDGGSAAVKAQTGASYRVMEQDVSTVESGGKADFYYNTPGELYPPTKVDRVLHDGDEVRLGGTVLVAHLTPGHTRGCTTWTMTVQEGGKTYSVVLIGGPMVNGGYQLVGKPSYPQIVADYERTFRVMKSLPADIFVAPHARYWNMEVKYARLQQNPASNPFVDPAGYRAFVASTEAMFRDKLAQQRSSPQSSTRQDLRR
jgi:metallo-beta-lactamase class B